MKVEETKKVKLNFLLKFYLVKSIIIKRNFPLQEEDF